MVPGVCEGSISIYEAMTFLRTSFIRSRIWLVSLSSREWSALVWFIALPISAPLGIIWLLHATVIIGTIGLLVTTVAVFQTISCVLWRIEFGKWWL